LSKLSGLRRSELVEEDARIFPGWLAPMMVMREGRRVVLPMRYQCRPSGKPAFYDSKFPATYNARRDNLEGFWGGVFGRTHGIMVVNAIFENVRRHAMEHRALAPGEKDEKLDALYAILDDRDKPYYEHRLAARALLHQSVGGDASRAKFLADLFLHRRS
jgi:hypothetical protein